MIYQKTIPTSLGFPKVSISPTHNGYFLLLNKKRRKIHNGNDISHSSETLEASSVCLRQYLQFVQQKRIICQLILARERESKPLLIVQGKAKCTRPGAKSREGQP